MLAFFSCRALVTFYSLCSKLPCVCARLFYSHRTAQRKQEAWGQEFEAASQSLGLHFLGPFSARGLLAISVWAIIWPISWLSVRAKVVLKCIENISNYWCSLSITLILIIRTIIICIAQLRKLRVCEYKISCLSITAKKRHSRSLNVVHSRKF